MLFGQRLWSLFRGKYVSSPQYTALPLSPTSTGHQVYGLGSRRKRIFTYTAIFLLLGVCWIFYSRDHGLLPAALSRPSRASLSKEQYIDAILRDPVEGLLYPEPIQKKCQETKYQEGLVWHCDTVVGGIGNVGNMWLNCVRYAMEAGATTLVLPRLGARGDNLIDLGGSNHAVELSTLFDVDYFLDQWKVVCPQIHAVVSDTDVANLPAEDSGRSPQLAPQDVKKFPMRKYLIVDPSGWREAFDTWLAQKVPGPAVSAEHPVRVHQRMVLAQWNRQVDPPAFGSSFPRLFRYPKQTRQLAAAVLWSLEQKLGRPVVADVLVDGSDKQATVNALGLGRLAPLGFFGAHMRVAADAAAAGWPGYDAQAPAFLSEAQKRNQTAIYLATGSDEHRAQFRKDAAAAAAAASEDGDAKDSLQVFCKEDLLDEDERATLQKLTWDQQALVDFDVLMHSSWFYGFVRSSFSWSLALRRGTLPEAGPSQVTEQLGDEYRDDLSAVVGRYPNINPEGLWP